MATTTIRTAGAVQRIRVKRFEPEVVEQMRMPQEYVEPEIDPYELERMEHERMERERYEQDLKAAYDRGVEDGRAIAAGMYDRELRRHQEWLRQFDKVVSELQHDYGKAALSIEDTVIRLATVLASQILEHDATSDNHVVVTQARKAFRRIQGMENVEIRVNPESYEALETARSQLLTSADNVRSISIVADTSIEVGGCVLYTKIGAVDAQLSTQLGELYQSMRNVADDEDIEIADPTAHEMFSEKFQSDIPDFINPNVKNARPNAPDEMYQDFDESETGSDFSGENFSGENFSNRNFSSENYSDNIFSEENYTEEKFSSENFSEHESGSGDDDDLHEHDADSGSADDDDLSWLMSDEPPQL